MEKGGETGESWGFDGFDVFSLVFLVGVECFFLVGFMIFGLIFCFLIGLGDLLRPDKDAKVLVRDCLDRSMYAVIAEAVY